MSGLVYIENFSRFPRFVLVGVRGSGILAWGWDSRAGL